MVFGLFRKRRERREAIARYREALHAALADEHLSDEELAHLSEVVQSMHVSPEDRARLNAEACRALWLRISADSRITPEETANFQRAVNVLDVTLEAADFDQVAWNKGTALAGLESGDGPPSLPTIDGLPIQPKSGEVFHWACSAALRSWKTRTTRVSYGGPMASIRIMKGVR